jgi:hypothetical protein
MTALLAKDSNKRQYFSVCTSTVINEFEGASLFLLCRVEAHIIS